ncbi:MAG: hypothetical protein E2P02_00265 [Acidobacteria bacterium]|nr:MAG: hypothetical protein E2P02_00265 [Acidobacteriota bacterium]
MNPGAPEFSGITGSSAALEDVERQHILQTLESVGWVVEGDEVAAERLGLNPSTLRSRMDKLGIKKPGH